MFRIASRWLSVTILTPLCWFALANPSSAANHQGHAAASHQHAATAQTQGATGQRIILAGTATPGVGGYGGLGTQNLYGFSGMQGNRWGSMRGYGASMGGYFGGGYYGGYYGGGYGGGYYGGYPNNGYSSGGPYGGYSGGAMQAVPYAPPLPPQGMGTTPASSQGGVAKILLRVPPAAIVWVDETKLDDNGTSLTYQTEAMQPGSTATHTVLVNWSEDGKEYSQTEKVRVRAGSWTLLSIQPKNRPAPATETR